jgi:hypothetical protein
MRQSGRAAALAVLAISLFTASALAQWIVHPTRGVPRLPDGRPNLGAPPPRTSDGKVDFSGMWQAAQLLPCDDVNRICTDLPISQQFINIGAGRAGGLPYQPWAKEKMSQHQPWIDPYTNCITPGGPRMHLLPTMKKFVQTPDLLLMLNEYNTHYRQIFLDGRALPPDPNPTWNGYSSARWEGDALVISSIGYRDDQWLDARGSPLTNAARVTERLSRADFGHLHIDVTVDDPKAYTGPWTVRLEQVIVVDTDMLDAVCWENEKDVEHLKNVK